MASDNVQVVYCLYQYRLRNGEQPFLHSMRHHSWVVKKAKGEFRVPAFNQGGIANVERVRPLNLDEKTAK